MRLRPTFRLGTSTFPIVFLCVSAALRANSFRFPISDFRFSLLWIAASAHGLLAMTKGRRSADQRGWASEDKDGDPLVAGKAEVQVGLLEDPVTAVQGLAGQHAAEDVPVSQNLQVLHECRLNGPSTPA